MVPQPEVTQQFKGFHVKINEVLKNMDPEEERRQLLEELLNPLLTLEQTRIILGVCATTARRWTNQGKLECIRTPGGQRRFLLSQVLKCMEEMENRGKRGGNNG